MKRRDMVLLALVAVLAAALFLWDRPRQSRLEQEQREAARLFQMEPAAVDTVRVESAGGIIMLIRRSDGWWLEEPVKEDANDPVAEAFVRGLLSATRLRTVADTGDTLALHAFALGGVEHGTVELEFRSATGRRAGLWVGRSNPTGSGCYARRTGSTQVDLVDASLRSQADISYHAFRHADLFDVKRDEIRRLSVRTQGGSLSASVDAKGLWSTEEPTPRRVKRHRVKGLVFAMEHARVRKFLEDHLEPREWSAYGLHEPLLDLSFETFDGRKGQVQLGNEEEPALHFGRRDGSGTLMLLTSQLLVSSEALVGDWLDTHPVVENFDALDSLRVEWHSGASAKLIHGADGWVADVPPWWGGDPERLLTPVENLTRGLEELESDATLYLSEGNSADEYLARRALVCRLYWPDFEHHVVLGWRSGEDAHWLRVDDGDELFRIERDLFFRLKSLLLALDLIGPEE